MKPKRSMDEAITAAKKLRQELAGAPAASEPAPDEARLRVIEPGSQPTTTPREAPAPPEPAPAAGRPAWVRHTVGLRSVTSLKLRDAAEAQKRKARYGTLGPDEPANEQEIADLGVTLALKHLGFE